MNEFAESLSLYRQRKAIQELLKCMNRKGSGSSNLSTHFHQMCQGQNISPAEYIYLKTRIGLNEFCRQAEEHFGRGAKTGFLFYSHNNHQLFYGAGPNYPNPMKKLLAGIRPTICLVTDEFYQDEFYVVPDTHEWVQMPVVLPDYAEAILHSNCRTLISSRIRVGDFPIGTFEVYFPEVEALRPSDLHWIRTQLPEKTRQLHEYRKEVLEALSSLPHSLITSCSAIS